MIKKTFLLTLVGLSLVACNKEEQKVTKLNSDDEKAAYAIGLDLAHNFKIQGFDKDLNVNIIKQAMEDKFGNKELLFSEDSIQFFMKDYIPKHLEKVSKRNSEESKKFLEENKKKDGVKTTASGLQYKVEKEGKGDKPSDEDIVSVNYILKGIDGSIIEDSKKQTDGKPADIPLSRVVPGWREGVKLMSKGAKYTLYVPSDLAYGDNGPAGPNMALIFEVELVDFKPMPKELKDQAGMEQLSPEQIEQLKNQIQQQKNK
ncbi:MAG: FKBP-type peptidyl-prolyl cis-trans isomerase [Apibacter sp.]|uniref:FKBP-type peptidyl-prolyl cis-trans isomerase N-terminal domain-containing protein n=1 Tax=Apibacter sp. TaxID=2023709 RepID=UPI0025FE6051|nr:FKBP-type peptidyl-prolyl cis-trans isomerase N-terminal domain-containing protein [Apibacter sp.]MCT6869271.1 FKBP-type peptidyl-prolyl cis-trans isomerase [Apibacter sp.]